MARSVCLLLLLLLPGGMTLPLCPDALPAPRPASPPDTSIDLSTIYGRIQFVDNFPDYEVKVVEHFPDLRVQRVEHFPDGPGQWQIVEHFPDFKIQIVDHFPDFTIQYVEHFPGVE